MTTTDITAPAAVDTRAAYTAGLRALADLLDEHPEIELPMVGRGQYTPVSFPVGFHPDISDDDAKAQVVAVARTVIAGPWTKKYDDDPEYGSLRVYGHTAAGLYVQIYAPREKVCRKVVTTSEVTKTIPDPAVTVPTVEVTESVESVEWVCEPLLAAEPVSA